jgi:protein O-GlcNAc transferase
VRSYGFSQEDVIMCSFNQYYKITPDLWKLWMAIMRAVPATKLWLIKFDAVDGPKNLKKECEAEGVDFSRIVISDMFPREREFLIKGLADLFLDTPEFNAHTTATDALWAGVPMVSLPGLNMAQRVASSLCKDAGMSHLLARNMEDYSRVIMRLVSSMPKLRAAKAQLHAARLTPAFDIELRVRAHEKGMKMAADM